MAGRPAILTVDDDPAVSRAVARDLRRRYGENYRIVRAESGREALDALRELALRGERAALLLADYRMPEMNGVAVPRTGDGHLPDRPAGAAHRLRRHRRGDPGHQRRRPGPLPAQALGPAGREALPRRRRPARHLALRRTARRSRDSRWSATDGRRVRTTCATSWRATTCRTAGSTLEERRGGGCSTRPVAHRRRPAGACSRRTATAASVPTDARDRRGHRARHDAELAFYDLIVVGGGPAGLGAAVYGASRGAADGARRAAGHGRPGRAELPHRELPRVPGRRVRRRACPTAPAVQAVDSASRCWPPPR